MTQTELLNMITIFLINSSAIMSFGLGGITGIAFVISANKRWF